MLFPERFLVFLRTKTPVYLDESKLFYKMIPLPALNTVTKCFDNSSYRYCNIQLSSSTIAPRNKYFDVG